MRHGVSPCSVATAAARVKAAVVALRSVIAARVVATLAGDASATRLAVAAVVDARDASTEAVAAMTAVSGIPLLLSHDLTGADAAIDSGVSVLIGRASMAPFSLFGVWALLRTVVDTGAAARDGLRTAFAGTRTINAQAIRYADAVVAGRAGRAREAAALLVEADRRLADWTWWRRLLHVLVLDAAVADGWGSRCRCCAPT